MAVHPGALLPWQGRLHPKRRMFSAAFMSALASWPQFVHRKTDWFGRLLAATWLHAVFGDALVDVFQGLGYVAAVSPYHVGRVFQVVIGGAVLEFGVSWVLS